MNDEKTTITTLRAQCKICGREFKYHRSGRLTGAPRELCDEHRRRRGTLRQNVVAVEER